ncbi:hypothetical protein ACFE04_024920 [Oxalis oulophora]
MTSYFRFTFQYMWKLSINSISLSNIDCQRSHSRHHPNRLSPKLSFSVSHEALSTSEALSFSYRIVVDQITVTSILITSKEKETSSLTRQFIPNASEILYENDIFEIKFRESNSPLNIFTGWGSLVTDICDTTSIADTVSSSPPPPLSQSPSPVRITAIAKAEAKGLNGIFFSSSLAIFKPSYATRGVDSFLERAADEGLVDDSYITKGENLLLLFSLEN